MNPSCMTASATRPETVALLEPGDTILTTEGDPFVVAETRRTVEGIDIYGWPPAKVGQQRRVKLPTIPANTDVLVLPTYEEQASIAQTILNAVERADMHWRDAIDNEDHSPHFRDGTTLVLRDNAGTVWRLDLAAAAPVEDPPAKRPSEAAMEAVEASEATEGS